MAAVGMGIGAGYYAIAAYASLLTIIVLSVLPYLENMIDRLNQAKTYIVHCSFSLSKKEDIEQLFRQYRLRYKLARHVKEDSHVCFTWQVQGRSKNHDAFIAIMVNDAAIERFEY